MGFRFRKSIPIGKHFRINLSKSGVGYSWGVKGARFTKTANGKNRTTLSVPGTGISTESKAHTSKKKPSKKKNVDQATVSAKQQRQQTAGAQNPPTNSAPTKSSPNITSFKTTYPVLFWIIAIAIWPISLSIWFLKTGNIKKLNKAARICLLATFWVVFCTVVGIAGYAKRAGGHPAFRPDLQNHFQSIAGSDCIVGTDSDPRAVSDAGADKHACSRNGQAACSTIASTARYTKQQRHAGKHFRFRRTNRTSARK